MNTPHDSSLGAFQDAFALALLAPAPHAAEPTALAALTRQPGFAIYRNTVLKGCIDALQCNYPTVAELVGEEWFRAAAAIHARAAPPIEPTLAHYGDGFEAFLAGFEPAASAPYLADIARLDRLWTEAHVARDEPTVMAADIAGLKPELLARTILRPHASARWAWFAQHPSFSIWRRSRDAACIDFSGLHWRAEGALIVRPALQVRWLALDAASHAFLESCAAGNPLAVAGAAGLAADASADLSTLFARLLEIGAFGLITTPDPTAKEDPP
ncbi:MAG TPA: DUF2063 domain-containing protein [Gammaproteobacteria bacterium]|nr:DUF2063 domain-containing protein [Gammaproteobacteria bacterium]